ncbi:MAG: oligoendopeptidase F [Rhodospirillaceae bacterium]|nr:oligoendopeptidase F [Rhodospirillaceae bacterium]
MDNQANVAVYSSGEILPAWDLSDLYDGIDSSDLTYDLTVAASTADVFARDYMGKLAELGPDEFGDAIQEYEDLNELLSRIMSYAQLLFAANSEDGEIATFYQDMSERVTAVSAKTLFFELEINRLKDAEIKAFLSSASVVRYKPWLENVRVYKSYQLSDEVERLLHEKSVTGRSAWSRLFDETMAGLRFKLHGRELTNSEIMTRMSDPKEANRKAASKAFAKGLEDNIKLFSLVTNTLAKDKEIEDTWRALPRPVSSRNLGNQVEDDVVDALSNSVRLAYPDLSHRYYQLKAEWMGKDVLNYWDRNAPLPEADHTRIEWPRAREAVLGSYAAFEPTLGQIAGQFFDKAWIDAAPRSGKNSGAFSHPTVPSAHPYILMNYHGKPRDVMTLAHELGHGIHQVLAAPQGHFLANTPLTLAETASVFGEMLTFQFMLESAQDVTARRVMLASKVEDMLNTVIRQIAFYQFEERVHEERRQGELSADRLGEIWMEVQTDSLGPAFCYDDEYSYFWAYIPHFIHAPFYVYAYAFGDCLVNSLYDLFANGHPQFQEKYLDMLKAGGTRRHKELLAPFGLDASNPAFWQRGLGVVSGFIDELEKIL